MTTLLTDHAFLVELRRALLIALKAVEQRLDQEPRQHATSDARKAATSSR